MTMLWGPRKVLQSLNNKAGRGIAWGGSKPRGSKGSPGSPDQFNAAHLLVFWRPGGLGFIMASQGRHKARLWCLGTAMVLFLAVVVPW